MSRAHALLFSAALIGLGASFSCGGRSPLGSLAYEQSSTNGGSGLGPGGHGPGGHGPGGHGPGGHGPGGEGGLGPGGQGQGGFDPIGCLGCVAQNCPDTLACVTDPACIQGIGCVVATCMSGGQPDMACALGCFNGDMSAALAALSAMTCVFGTCGDTCGGLIPGG